MFLILLMTACDKSKYSSKFANICQAQSKATFQFLSKIFQFDMFLNLSFKILENC